MTICRAHKKQKPCVSCAKASVRSKATWQTAERRKKHRVAMSRRETAWFDEELEFIQAHVGKMSSYEMRDNLNEIRDKYKARHRSVGSVRAMVESMGLTLHRDGSYSVNQLCELFCVTSQMVSRWVESKWLTGRAWGQFTIFDEDEVLSFAQEYPWAFTLSKMPPSKFKTSAELVTRRNPWLCLKEISRIVGIRDETIAIYLKKYNIPHVTRPGHNGRILVQASNIDLIRESYAKSVANRSRHLNNKAA